MSHIISIVPVTPIRSEPSHRSEQVSQLLFGEVGLVIETSKDFSKIKCLYDGYEGWCQTSQLTEISEEQASTEQNLLVKDWVREITINNTPVYIPFGSSLSLFKHGIFRGKLHEAFYEGEAFDCSESGFNEEMIKPLAYKFTTRCLSTSNAGRRCRFSARSKMWRLSLF
jgi:hypothetical protein